MRFERHINKEKQTRIIMEGLDKPEDIVFKFVVSAAQDLSNVIIALNWALKKGAGVKKKELTPLYKTIEKSYKQLTALSDVLAKQIVGESSITGDVVGSSQTRVVGTRSDITVLRREPRPLEFDDDTGSYSPTGDYVDDLTETDNFAPSGDNFDDDDLENDVADELRRVLNDKVS